MKIGVQVSSLKPLLTTSEGVAEAFLQISKMGVEIVQLQWIDRTVPVSDIAKALENAHLTSLSVQEIYETFSEDPEYFLKLSEETGSRYLCLSRIPQRYKTPEGISAFAEKLGQLAEELSGRNLLLCFHPVAADFQAADKGNFVERLLELLPDLELCLDLYQVNRAGLSMVQWIRSYRNRICMVHFKDYSKTADGREILVPAGQGDICWDGVFSACEEAGIPYAFAEQETWNRDPYECLREALKFCTDAEKSTAAVWEKTVPSVKKTGYCSREQK